MTPPATSYGRRESVAGEIFHLFATRLDKIIRLVKSLTLKVPYLIHGGKVRYVEGREGGARPS